MNHAFHLFRFPFLVAFFVTGAVASCEPHRGDKATRPVVVSDGSDRSADADAPPTPIREAPATPRALPAPQLAADRGYLQQFGAPARDSRLGVRLALGPYRPRWQAALQEAPRATLTGGDRVVVEARDGWELFNLDGKPAGRGAHDGLLLDPAKGVLYSSHASGMYAGWSLADGALAFAFPTRQSGGFQREPIARRGSQLLLASIEQPIMSASSRMPETSLLEWQDLGTPMEIDSQGAVMSARAAAMMLFHAVPICVALAGDLLVVAAPRRVIFAEAATLKVTRQLTAEFSPLSVSLDETGYAHLLVRTPTGAALWLLAASGDRVTADLPADLGVPETPPILGFDHAIHLFAGARLVTLTPEGKPAWTATFEAPIAGAVALPGGLLVAAGTELVAFDAAGTRHLVHHFEGIRLTTAPILTAGGQLLVASDRTLFSLAP